MSLNKWNYLKFTNRNFIYKFEKDSSESHENAVKYC